MSERGTSRLPAVARAAACLFMASGIIMNAMAGERMADGAPVRAPSQADQSFADDVRTIRQARVYFNHMSVGDNVLDGLGRLARPLGGLSFVEVRPGKRATLGEHYFAHSFGGRNGAPLEKIEAFAGALTSGTVSSPDVALMKLCYVDFSGSSDVRALFARYSSALKDLERRYPNTVFVHVTVPLVVKGSGWKEYVKQLTGIKDETARANIRRHEYNELMRSTFKGSTIFDLALHESVWPDGTRETFERRGIAYPSLVPAYASDGKHLNEAGQDRMARELASTLARALDRRNRREQRSGSGG